jgi:hypothetical protein
MVTKEQTRNQTNQTESLPSHEASSINTHVPVDGYLREYRDLVPEIA